MRIRNIIFDLGGVLLNLDFQKSFTAFRELGVADFEKHFQQSYSNPLFARLEKGACSPAEFYHAFRHETGIIASDIEIESAWNAMLLDFRDASMQFLVSLKKNYRIFLLSNTNEIHLQAFREIHFRQYGHHGFDDHFEKACYSHELGLRKPDVACYLEVMKQHQLTGGETLFVDDTLINIEGAREAGLQSFLLEKSARIEEQLPSLLFK